MKTPSASTANDFRKNQSYRQAENSEERTKPQKSSISRRSFLGKSLAVGAGTIGGAGLLTSIRTAEASGGLTPGDAALLRFAAAAELLETDFWVQYNELGGIQDSEVPGGSGNSAYTDALEVLDEDMAVYQPRDAFNGLWQSINGSPSWDANPWIWALTFKVHKCNVADLLSQKAA